MWHRKSTVVNAIRRSCHTLPDEQAIVTTITSLLKTLNPKRPNSFSDSPIISSEPLNQFSRHLNPNIVIRVINNNQTDPFHALFFFDWASQQSPDSRTHHCFVAITELLLRHSLFSTASSLLLRHNKLRDSMIWRVVKALGDRGDLRGAIHWFRRAKAIEKGRCLLSYNAILAVFVKSRRVDLAKAFYDQILEEGLVEPDVYTYTTMIRGFCKVGQIENARHMFDEMLCEPNLITWNSMISGFCGKGDMDSARRFLKTMIECKSCSPDTVTYTSLIDGYCKKGDVNGAFECFKEMHVRGCEPNLMTYNVMIHGLCLLGDVEAAKSLISRMRAKGFKDDVVTHTAILKGLCLAKNLEGAGTYLKEMVDLGINPDVVSYGIVLNEYCRVNKPDEALSLLYEMCDERGLNPNASSFNMVIKVYCANGELDRAIGVLKMMSEMGRAPNFVSYNTVIRGLCRCRGSMVEIEEIVGLMSGNGHKLDGSLYGCLVEGYCGAQDFDKAKRVFYEALDQSHVIGLDSFSAFMKDLFASGKNMEGVSIFEDFCRRFFNVVDVSGYKKVLDELLCTYSGQQQEL